MSSEATGLVTIKSVPSGEAPEEIRAAWVGLTLPCFPVAGLVGELGVSSGKLKEKQRFCVVVPQSEAIAILAKKDPAASAWWNRHGYPNPLLSDFTFGENEVTIVSGVTHQKIIEVTDEMMGDPNR